MIQYILASVVLLLLLIVPSSGGNATDVHGILKDCMRVMATVDGIRVTGTTTVTERSNEHVALELVFESYIAPRHASSMRGRALVRSSEYKGYIFVEMIRIDGLTYVRDPVTGEWGITEALEEEENVSAFASAFVAATEGTLKLLNPVLESETEDTILIRGIPSSDQGVGAELQIARDSLVIKSLVIRGDSTMEQFQDFFPSVEAWTETTSYGFEILREPPTISHPEVSRAQGQPRFRRFSSKEKGVAFAYPASWSVRDDADMIEFTEIQGKAVLSVRMLPKDKSAQGWTFLFGSNVVSRRVVRAAQGVMGEIVDYLSEDTGARQRSLVLTSKETGRAFLATLSCAPEEIPRFDLALFGILNSIQFVEGEGTGE